MNRTLLVIALLGLSAAALPAAAQSPGTYAAPNATTPAPIPPMTPPGPSMAPQPPDSSGPPGLPALSPEQSANLNQEMARYRQWVDERLAHGELRPDEAQRLVEWRRWQLARQIAGLAPPEPRVAEPRYVVREPYGPYPYYAPPAPAYYAPPVPAYYYGPRISVCAGGWGHHSFGSVCF